MDFKRLVEEGVGHDDHSRHGEENLGLEKVKMMMMRMMRDFTVSVKLVTR